MTIDEAIENLKYDIEIDMYIRDIAPQIAEWLEELKLYRVSVFSGNMTQAMLKEEYCKAVDDFAKKFIVLSDDGEFMTRLSEFPATTILELAERLKVVTE